MTPPSAHPDRSHGKFLTLNPALYHYLLDHRSPHPDDVLLDDLRRETAALGDSARMQISAEQGSFLRILASLLGARNILEIGTFTGYSALCLARALPAGGRLTCLDVSEEWTAMARRYWRRAGLADRIDLRLGDARQTLAALDTTDPFDLVFIDADKSGYDTYYELALPRLRANGLILFDNMLWGGRLTSEQNPDASARAILAMNQKLATDPRVECVLLSVADGLQLCRKR